MIIDRENEGVRICAVSTERETAKMSAYIIKDPPDTNHPLHRMTTAYIDDITVEFHYMNEQMSLGYRFTWNGEWKYVSVNRIVYPIYEGERLTIVTF